MYYQFTKRSVFLIFSFCFFSVVSYSQIKDFDFLRSVPADGVKYLQAYMTPWANAFGAGLNGGWYNTAKPHKLGGFDITLNASAGVVPTSAETFDISKIGLSSSISITGTGLASTVAGPKTEGPPMDYKAGGVTLASFNAPQGVGLRYVPVPTAQVGIGLPFGTELKVRFIPKINIRDGDVSLWGVGLVHSIMQYLPGNKLLQFDVSLFAGFTKLKGNIPLDLKPEPGIVQSYSSPFDPLVSFNDQFLKMSVQALNISAIGSVTLPVITFYGGLGYCKTRTVMDLSGNFPTPTLNIDNPANPYAEYTNEGVVQGNKFPSMDIKNFSGLRANIGFRLKLAVVTIHADYTRAQYNVLTAGLGISFR